MENGAEAAVLHMLCCGGVIPGCSQELHFTVTSLADQ